MEHILNESKTAKQVGGIILILASIIFFFIKIDVAAMMFDKKAIASLSNGLSVPYIIIGAIFFSFAFSQTKKIENSREDNIYTKEAQNVVSRISIFAVCFILMGILLLM